MVFSAWVGKSKRVYYICTGDTYKFKIKRELRKRVEFHVGHSRIRRVRASMMTQVRPLDSYVNQRNIANFCCRNNILRHLNSPSVAWLVLLSSLFQGVPSHRRRRQQEAES
jgi:hypothetical protein